MGAGAGDEEKEGRRGRAELCPHRPVPEQMGTAQGMSWVGLELGEDIRQEREDRGRQRVFPECKKSQQASPAFPGASRGG